VAHRTLDEIVSDTEHAQPMHPMRALIDNHLYLDGFVERGGMSLILMNGLVLVPLIMAAFFYPVEVLLGTGAVLLVAFVLYEAVVIWRRRHPVART